MVMASLPMCACGKPLHYSDAGVQAYVESMIAAKGECLTAGSVYGVDEVAILDSGATYINIGNANVHGFKEIMKLPHERFQYPWLFSRASDQTANDVRVWKGRKP